MSKINVYLQHVWQAEYLTIYISNISFSHAFSILTPHLSDPSQLKQEIKYHLKLVSGKIEAKIISNNCWLEQKSKQKGG